MFIKRSTSIQKRKSGKSKTYTSVFLVESVRKGKKVEHRSLLNLSKWSAQKIDAFDSFLKGKTLSSLIDVKTIQGKSIGALSLFSMLSKETGLTRVIEKQWLAKVLFLVIGRILTQGSRLHLLEWGQTQETEEVLGLTMEELTVDHLYDTLDYLAANQDKIEEKLFNFRKAKTGTPPLIYLYDVTSSYLEGEQNELAFYGYNRDKKQGKKQIVIGLLTDENGYPLAIRVFEGNTSDPKTVHEQIKKLAISFGVKSIILVGDKGMLKKAQIKELSSNSFHYITTITKPQIQTLIKNGLIQLSLFDEKLGEIVVEEQIEEKTGNLDVNNSINSKAQFQTHRYIYRRNPIRAQELEITRLQKQANLQIFVVKKNEYLKLHPKAKTETVKKQIANKIKKLNLTFVSLSLQGRVFSTDIDEALLQEEKALDGCFVIKTNYMNKEVTKQTIHDRYKDLKNVESAFRTIKTGFLEVRPIFLRKASRTKGHVFVTMLSYLLIHEFKNRTKEINATLQHKVDTLDKVQTVSLQLGEHRVKRVVETNPFVKQLLSNCHITLPVFCST